MSPEEKNQNEKKSFWNTTIGIITKITAVLTAVTGLIIAFRNFNNTVSSDTSSSQSTTAPSSTGAPSPGEQTTKVQPIDIDANKIKPEEKKPDLQISSFSISPDEITLDQDAKPKPFIATIEAFNNGNGLAENCVFTLISDGGVIENAKSESFSLDPNTKKQIIVNATISNSGKIVAKLSCSNDTEKSSSPVNLTVFNYGTVHHIFPKAQ